MKIGAHVSTAGGISKAVARGVEIGCETIQIFGSSPQGWAFKPVPATEVEAFRREVADAGMGPVFLHAINLINLGTPGAAHLEKGHSIADQLYGTGRGHRCPGSDLSSGQPQTIGHEAMLPQTVDTIKKVLDASPRRGSTPPTTAITYLP